MSLFENVGRRVEKFKQQMTAAADAEAQQKCTECETLLYTARETCPECGSEALVPIADDESPSDS